MILKSNQNTLSFIGNKLSKTLPFFNGLLLLAAISLPALSLPRNTSLVIRDSPKEVLDQVWQIIYREYLDSNGNYNDESWLKLRKKVLSNKYYDSAEAYEAIVSMLKSLKDPYTRFLDPKDYKEMRIDTSGELMGIGIQLSLNEETNELVIVAPIEDTPAFKAGIQPNDIIVSIDDTDTDGMSIDGAVKLIRGEKGTKVTLGIIRGTQYLKVPLIRSRIEIRSVISRLNETSNGGTIGYIRLKQFSANAATEMRSAIIKLEEQKSQGYILDLRGNPGGLLEASIDIARQWLNTGIIVSTLTKDGINDFRRATGNALTNKPLVVLVNEGSASASEILAGAIQDNKRGILVGSKTFGKGLVQSVRPLVDGSGITVTVAKYLTPNGTDINKNGIKPDIKASLNLNNNKSFSAIDLGTSKDSQYVVAETALSRIMFNLNSTSYKQNTANLSFALK
ncbi:S41 family peptidase [Prochlorococcus marinus]|uniref:C-terminal processing peptidase n=1 Tax=Prochlorococcus marinus (strain MIT 9211) TaxID=93059 RepID=A9BA60_PROM4|nr:S41 family peptidase [Prochlorococcus marinus]ABX08722.1 carboxyl-terminal processing protease [Prochlorococcus marinus str. MIT 9211]